MKNLWFSETGTKFGARFSTALSPEGKACPCKYGRFGKTLPFCGDKEDDDE